VYITQKLLEELFILLMARMSHSGIQLVLAQSIIKLVHV